MKRIGIYTLGLTLVIFFYWSCNNTSVPNRENEFYDYIKLGMKTTLNDVLLTYLVVSVDSFDYSESPTPDYCSFPMISSIYDSISDGNNEQNHSVDLLPFMLINQHKFNSITPLFEIWDAFVYERYFFPNGLTIGLAYLRQGVNKNHLICSLENNYYKQNGLNAYPIDTLQSNRNKVRIICTGDTSGIAEIESDFRARQLETLIIPYYMILTSFHHHEEYRQPMIDLLEKYAPRYPQARKLLNDYRIRGK